MQSIIKKQSEEDRIIVLHSAGDCACDNQVFYSDRKEWERFSNAIKNADMMEPEQLYSITKPRFFHSKELLIEYILNSSNP